MVLREGVSPNWGSEHRRTGSPAAAVGLGAYREYLPWLAALLVASAAFAYYDPDMLGTSLFHRLRVTLGTTTIDLPPAGFDCSP
jgi:hypothetical protein